MIKHSTGNISLGEKSEKKKKGSLGNKDIEKYLRTLEILESHIYIQGRMGIERRPKETLSSCLWLISRLKPKVKARTES